MTQTARVLAGNIVIQVADRVVAMYAERGRLDTVRLVHLSIVNSTRVNLQWFNRYAQLVDHFIRAKMQEIRVIGEFSRALSRTSSQISEQRGDWVEMQAAPWHDPRVRRAIRLLSFLRADFFSKIVEQWHALRVGAQGGRGNLTGALKGDLFYLCHLRPS